MIPGHTPWYDDNPADCPDCPGDNCTFCGGAGIIPRWVVEPWPEE